MLGNGGIMIIESVVFARSFDGLSYATGSILC